jgi:hypothetical protein
MVSPENSGVADANQLNVDAQPIAEPLNAAIDHGVGSKFSSRDNGIVVRSGIFPNRTRRPHLDLLEITQPRNQCVGDTEFKIFLATFIS